MINSYGATLSKFCEHFGTGCDLAAITSEQVVSVPQWYLGKITDGQATRWIENLYGWPG